jgi:hypothetical protein
MLPDSHYISFDFSNRWLFRWRFEFHGNQPTHMGGWFPATRFQDMAAAVNKEGLAVAMIEGKNFLTKEVKVFADCPGFDFINFQHLALYINSCGKVTQRTHGMRLIHRHGVVNCYETGVIENERREYSEADGYPEWTRY